VQFFTDHKELVAKSARFYGIRTDISGYLPRQDMLRAQRQSHLLLILNWEDPDWKGSMPTKLFDYLSSGRRILASGGYHGTEVERILASSGAGTYACTEGDIIEAVYSAYLASKKFAPGQPDPEEPDPTSDLLKPYSSEASSDLLCTILRRCS
jgi:hypothetical protein